MYLVRVFSFLATSGGQNVGVKSKALLVMAVVACTSATDPTTSASTTTTETLDVAWPCASASGDIDADTRVVVQTDDDEVVAAMRWIDLPPCTDDGQGVVSDGFFADLESTILRVDVGDDVRIHAPAFDGGQLEVTWSVDDSSDRIRATQLKVEPGLWEIVEIPEESGVYTMDLRFEYGRDLSAVFALMADVGE